MAVLASHALAGHLYYCLLFALPKWVHNLFTFSRLSRSDISFFRLSSIDRSPRTGAERLVSSLAAVQPGLRRRPRGLGIQDASYNVVVVKKGLFMGLVF